ncbi:hypothetical protein NEIRO02_2626, partial [Nematocida sp. AWRm79]
MAVGKAGCSRGARCTEGAKSRGAERGREDLAARGEIQRLAEDGQRRRRLPGTLSLIRDEGRRSEDD